jgi:predicted nucleic acid-binding protein
MNYLIDTCVLSEFTRREPEEKIIEPPKVEASVQQRMDWINN